MRLEQMAFVARPRTPWEAVDLGLRMARAWWWPLTLSWLMLAMPLALLFWLLPIPNDWVLWLIWWLKPLFERPQLYILSRAVFGSVPTMREIVRALPSMMASQWFSSLTWRRLSPSRSYDLPLVMLEGASGKNRRRRMELLHREQYSQSVWLTLIGYHLEMTLCLACLVLILMLVTPDDSVDLFGSLLEQEWGWTLFGGLAMALVAPFYVAGGFALYLNRRIHLEGWDIELAFRRLAARRTTNNAPATLLLLVGLGLLWAWPATPLWAQEESQVLPVSELWGAERERMAPEAVRSRIREIVESDQLREKSVIKIPKFLTERTDRSKTESPFWMFFAGWSDWVLWVARGIEWLAWLAVATLVGLVLLRYRTWLRLFVEPSQWRASRSKKPETMFGLDVRETSLPAHVPGAVWELWQQGQPREAMGLLYRATLSRLMHQRGFEFQGSDTETDCLRQVQAAGEVALAEYFGLLTRLWQGLAYGHRAPDEQAVQYLCRHWEPLFGTAERGA